jgi:heme/copper-type cytochrome/quinol oxidase subunit 1
VNPETTSAAPTTPHWIRGRFSRWIFATDHKMVGLLWLTVGGIGILLGGILAVISALQTARPDEALLGEGTYASVVTMQGTLLTYGGILPLALGLAIIVLPLQLGAHGLRHASVSAIAFWFGAAGILSLVLSSFSKGDAPRSSWTTVPSEALDPSRPGESVRLLGLILVGSATLLTAISLIATFRGPRAPGLTNERLPLFAVSVGVFAAAQLVLSPLALLGDALLVLARKNPGSFDWYIEKDGTLQSGYGWVFSQAIVAVVVVVALGAAAEIVATFQRGALAPRRLVALALVAAGVLVAIVPGADTVDGRRWASVLAVLALLPVAAAAVMLLLAGFRAAGASATESPLPFALGSLVLVLTAAVASVVVAIAHNDLRGTTFESARLDLLWSAILVALLGGTIYWWPKLTGRVMNARTTNLAAAVIVASALVLAVGRAIAGWNDQPSHAGVTIDGAGAGSLIGTIGVIGMAVGILLVGIAKLRARNGRRVGNDPWHGDTLEWYTTSPPPPHNFDRLPPVASERPLDDLRQTIRARNAL